jgi:hypothetical protein
MVAYQYRSVHRHGILETLRDATMGSSWEQIRLLEILPGANQANKNSEYAIPTLRGANRSLQQGNKTAANATNKVIKQQQTQPKETLFPVHSNVSLRTVFNPLILSLECPSYAMLTH